MGEIRPKECEPRELTKDQLADGTAYVGAWHRGQRHGQGEERLPSGGRYVGSWANDLREGYGELSEPNGCSYRGDWKRGMRHGQGEAVLHSGSGEGAREEKVYEGGWARDAFEGKGVLRCADGRKYDGDWVGG